MLRNLGRELKDKTAAIGIVGLGYVGLPLALTFAKAAFKIFGLDIQQKRVDLVNSGQSYIADVDSRSLSEAIAGKRLEVTTDQSRVRKVDAVCICVPTFLTKTKDSELSCVISESETVYKYLQSGQLVVLESTTYPGTTREVLLPILERLGLNAGRDFQLAFLPKMFNPRSKNFNINNPRL